MKNKEILKQIISFEERLLSLRLKNSREKDFLLCTDDKDKKLSKKISTKSK